MPAKKPGTAPTPANARPAPTPMTPPCILRSATFPMMVFKTGSCCAVARIISSPKLRVLIAPPASSCSRSISARMAGVSLPMNCSKPSLPMSVSASPLLKPRVPTSISLSIVPCGASITSPVCSENIFSFGIPNGCAEFMSNAGGCCAGGSANGDTDWALLMSKPITQPSS